MSFTAVEQKIADLLESNIYSLQRLYIDELGRVDPTDTTKVYLSYKQQRFDHPIIVRKRDGTWSNLLSGTNYIVDDSKGLLTLVSGTTLPLGTEARIEYTFKYFSDDELKKFFQIGLDMSNAYMPATAFTLDASLPLEWNSLIALWAEKLCLERLLTDQGVWNRGLIFKEPDKYFTYLNNVLTDIRQFLREMLKSYKARRYIRGQVISTGKFATQQLINETNFRNFTVLGGG